MKVFGPITALEAFRSVQSLPVESKYSAAVQLIDGLRPTGSLKYPFPATAALSNITRGPKTDPTGQLKRARQRYLDFESVLLADAKRRQVPEAKLDAMRASILVMIGDKNLIHNDDTGEMFEFDDELVQFARKVHDRAIDYVDKDLQRLFGSASVYVEGEAVIDQTADEVPAEVIRIQEPIDSVLAADAAPTPTPVQESSSVNPKSVVTSQMQHRVLDARVQSRSQIEFLSHILDDELGVFEAVMIRLESLKSKFSYPALEKDFIHGRLKPEQWINARLVDLYDDLLRNTADLHELLSDPAMVDLAIEEYLPKIQAVYGNLLNRLQQKLETSEVSSVVVEINAQFQLQHSHIDDVFGVYERLIARKNDWQLKDVQREYDGRGVITKLTFIVSGAGVAEYFNKESGHHKVTFSGDHIAGYTGSKKATHSLLIQALPVLECADDVEIRDEDLDIQFFAASTKGGQHANKTSTGVLIKHIPTGIQVRINSTRSQNQNLNTALGVLRYRLKEIQHDQLDKLETKLRRERRFEDQRRVRVWNLISGVVTDERFGETFALRSIDDFDPNLFLKASLRETLTADNPVYH